MSYKSTLKTSQLKKIVAFIEPIKVDSIDIGAAFQFQEKEYEIEIDDMILIVDIFIQETFNYTSSDHFNPESYDITEIYHSYNLVHIYDAEGFISFTRDQQEIIEHFLEFYL